MLAFGILLALQTAPPPQGPVLYWKLDEAAGTNADDSSSASANDGTWAGGPVPSTDRPTLAFTNPQSLSFDGVDDQVTRAAVGGLTAGNTAHTMAAWLKVNALPANRAWIA